MNSPASASSPASAHKCGGCRFAYQIHVPDEGWGDVTTCRLITHFLFQAGGVPQRDIGPSPGRVFGERAQRAQDFKDSGEGVCPERVEEAAE